MKLAFEGFEKPIELLQGQVTTLEIENKTLFSRVVQSLVSKGGEPEEPFSLWIGEKRVNPDSVFFYVPDIFNLPYSNHALESELYESLHEEFLVDNDKRIELENLVNEVEDLVSKTALSFSSSYSFGLSWKLDKLLKALDFRVGFETNARLIDNLIEFITFLHDIRFKKWVVFINLKLFFNQNDLDTFLNQANFFNISCLLLESIHNVSIYENENKYSIDQALFEHW
ncbi:MAG: type II-A CRISPR-associated protein Csn2 [Eggerthellaceae bacterium]|jgi:CRISPR type II-A-associated protein Csn2